MENNIIESQMSKEMSQSFINYAIAVITNRALPDIRDGMKPVHRRIIYSMANLGMYHNKPHKKSARIVGDVLGKYHPHGDSSVYGAMVRLAQDFSLRYPLIDGQGNFGSIDGDAPAQMRYTEARLSKCSEDLLCDIKKNVVEFKQNFSEDEMEPVVLPSKFPHLLANGTTGVAVGMACSFPPHNINNTIDSITSYLKDNDITEELLAETIVGPDFPTGGVIINKLDLKEAYRTGRGKIKVRGKYIVEEGSTPKQNKKIIFYEIPYMKKKEAIITKIIDLCKLKTIDGIVDVRDESAKDIRIVIEVNKNFDPDHIANMLFAKTDLAVTVSLNFTCLINNQPKTVSLKELITHYSNFQYEMLINKTNFDLKKINDRLHILTGLIKALADIDKTIEIIKASQSTTIAKQSLMKHFLLTDMQADAILSMKLSRLTKIKTSELEKEFADKTAESNYLSSILSNKELQTKLLLKDLDDMKVKYGDNRRTILENIVVEKIGSGKTKEVKPLSIQIQSNFKVSKISNGHLKDGSYHYNDNESIAVLTDKGMAEKIAIKDIQTGCSLTSKILNDIIITVIKNKENKKYFVIVTANGYIKKSLANVYDGINRRGSAIKLETGDKVVAAFYMNDEDLALLSANGNIIRFPSPSINPIGKLAKGVAGMKLSDKDKVVSATPISADSDSILILSDMGYIKRVSLKDVTTQNRNGKGLKCFKPSIDVDYAKIVKDSNIKNSVRIYHDNKLKVVSGSSVVVKGRTSSGMQLLPKKGSRNVVFD